MTEMEGKNEPQSRGQRHVLSTGSMFTLGLGSLDLAESLWGDESSEVTELAQDSGDP